MWALAGRPYSAWEEVRVEIDRVLISPAQRRIEGRPEQRRPGRRVVIAVIDEAADGAGLSMASILLAQARPG